MKDYRCTINFVTKLWKPVSRVVYHILPSVYITLQNQVCISSDNVTFMILWFQTSDSYVSEKIKTMDDHHLRGLLALKHPNLVTLKIDNLDSHCLIANIVSFFEFWQLYPCITMALERLGKDLFFILFRTWFKQFHSECNLGTLPTDSLCLSFCDGWYILYEGNQEF